jgi:hypothetical protein
MYPPADVDDDSNTVGAQLVARGALGAHQVPGVLVASSVESFETRTASLTSPAARRDVADQYADAAHARGGGRDPSPGGSPVDRAEPALGALSRRLPSRPAVRPPSEQTGGTRTQDFFTPRLGVRADVGWGITSSATAAAARACRTCRSCSATTASSRRSRSEAEVAVSWDLGFRRRARGRTTCSPPPRSSSRTSRAT